MKFLERDLCEVLVLRARNRAPVPLTSGAYPCTETDSNDKPMKGENHGKNVRKRRRSDCMERCMLRLLRRVSSG